MQLDKISQEAERLTDEMTKALSELIRTPAIGPENGGTGETAKAEKLTRMLQSIGFDKIERYDAEDARVPSKKRPNIVAYYNGENKNERLWIISHMDIVPPGEESLWTITKPYEPTIKNGCIYGRGSEDNGHSIIASIFAVKTLKNLGIKPERTVALAFVADEEHGSKYGIQHLIAQGLFKKDDLIIVPDGGSEDGSFIEISEKSALWLRIRTIGAQTHASRPHKGLNAYRIGMEYALALDKMLHEKYPIRDEYFDPPTSTFEPTMKEKNVDAINIVPGEDITYFDCRILPNYNLEEILSNINKLAREYEEKTGAKIKIEIVTKSVAPKPTDPKAKIVLMLEDAIKKTRQIKPKVGGIGGGTCAAFFRKIKIPAVVWCTIDETAHQPNEYTKIKNLVADAKIFALLATT
ncbi:MAG TPA: M20 family metallo-hydrolase [Candidatus Bathyarchaeia archaeon]|jgi:succinyl-diaminopimelate desuccinylase|nr:M20 family metallo-hydrolase [Candidatus Bathyarchaeia archaeon]